MESEQLEKLGFKNMGNDRFAINGQLKTVIIFTKPDSKLHIQGIPLVQIESEEHLRDVLDALRTSAM